MNSLQKMFTLSFFLSLILSCFLVLQFVGCKDSKSSDDPVPDPTWRMYSDADEKFILTISENDTMSAKADYVPKSDHFYKLQYKDAGGGDVISSGTVEVEDSVAEGTGLTTAITFNPTSGNTSFVAVFRMATIFFDDSDSKSICYGKVTVTDDRDNISTYKLPLSLNPSDRKIFFKGYNNATPTTAAYIYYALPKQYAYIYGQNKTTNEADQDLFQTNLLLTPETVTGQSTTSGKNGYKIENWVTMKEAMDNTPQPAGVITESWDARRLYSYYFTASSDGYNWRANGNLGQALDGYIPDLSWGGEFEFCYITTSNEGRNIFVIPMDNTQEVNRINGRKSGGNIVNNFRNGKWTENIFALRTINVQLGDSLQPTHNNLVRVQTGATKERSDPGRGDYPYKFHHITETKLSGQTVIKISDNFFTNYVTANVADLELRDFFVVGLDNSEEKYSWAEIQKAYFIPDKEVIVIIEGGSQSKSVKYPVTIRVSGTEFTPGNAYSTGNTDLTPPAYAASSPF